jgi:hypothetical protein
MPERKAAHAVCVNGGRLSQVQSDICMDVNGVLDGQPRVCHPAVCLMVNHMCACVLDGQPHVCLPTVCLMVNHMCAFQAPSTLALAHVDLRNVLALVQGSFYH